MNIIIPAFKQEILGRPVILAAEFLPFGGFDGYRVILENRVESVFRDCVSEVAKDEVGERGRVIGFRCPSQKNIIGFYIAVAYSVPRLAVLQGGVFIFSRGEVEMDSAVDEEQG